LTNSDDGRVLDTALLRLADRLEAEGHPYVALAARQAATAVQADARSESDLRIASLRRQAIEVALQLDMIGLPADAQAVLDEIVRRATGADDAMPNGTFKVWLDAIRAQFDLDTTGS
jgi:hypothetical protein